jgi:predicted GIY-YIG superfamily endonuclease
MYHIYWIGRESHGDINTEGYVGITRDFDKRIKQGRANSRIVANVRRR